MNFENFKFTIEENEDGYTVIIKGDKEKIKAKLDALESFVDFKKKAKIAGCEHKERSYSLHETMKTRYKEHFQNGEHPFKHRHSECGCNEDDSTNQNEK